MNNNEPNVTARLESARRKQWHQQGEALLTIENARSFLNAAGLVLFAPRPQIAAPAPSFVEAVLGAPNPAPSLPQIAQAREMLARLTAEGLAVPLNLLGIGSVVGQSSDAPDFIVSAPIFSYVFTLRGDKAWKQPPQAAGPAKVSHLAIAAHLALTARGPLSASDLARELGKEVTEAAVLRALGELWSHLRVLPLLQPDGHPTLWELAGTRLTRQIKAGANAGLPTALSTLVSLYLGQAMVATEDEIESFLSPLSARSRVRDVLHALLAAQQLDTVAIEGRTMLHVAGESPAFLSEETSALPVAPAEADRLGDVAAAEAAPPEAAAADGEQHGRIEPVEPGSRIAKFTPRPKPAADELAKAKPAAFARKPFGEARKPFDRKKPFTPRDGKARPPFQKKAFTPRDSESKPRFQRPDREGAKPDRERRPFVKREGSAARPPRKSFDRPAAARPPRKFAGRSAEGRPPRTPFVRRGEGQQERSERKPFERKPFERKPFERKPFERSARRPAGAAPAARKPFAGSGEGRARKPFAGSGEGRARKPFERKPSGFERRPPSGGRDRPAFKPKSFARREESGAGDTGRPGGFGGKRPFAKPGAEGRPFGGRERGEAAKPGRAGFGGKKFGSRRPDGAKPSGAGGGFGGKKFGARPGGAKFAAKPGAAKFGAAKFGPKKFGAKKSVGRPKGPRGPKPPQGENGA